MMNRALATLQFYLPIVRPYFPHAAVLLLFALLGWSSGYFSSTKPADNPSLKDTWSVPVWAPYRAGPEKAVFMALDIWDGKKPRSLQADKLAVTQQQAWQLVGTARTGKSYVAVIQLADGVRIQRAKAGDALPNGEKILVVERGAIQIEVGGDQRVIKLFQQEKK
jgi:hypothetical protein